MVKRERRPSSSSTRERETPSWTAIPVSQSVPLPRLRGRPAPRPSRLVALAGTEAPTDALALSSRTTKAVVSEVGS